MFFFICFATILSMELFYWEELSGDPQDWSHKFSNGAIASLMENGEDSTGKTSASIDPAINILLGIGVVGIVGLRRKSIQKKNP